MGDVVARLVAEGQRRRTQLESTFVGRCWQRMRDIDGTVAAVTLAGQAFIAVVPLMLVAASMTTAEGGGAVAEWLIDTYDLEGSTAAAVEQLFESPPGTTSGITVLGALILLVSVGGFGRSLQRTYERAWSLSARGMRGTVEGIGGMLVLVASLALLTWVSHLVGGRLLALPVQVAAAVPLWLLFTSMMLSRRVSRRRLLPGAVVSAAGQVALGWWTAIYVPRLITKDAEKYGVIGVAFALVSWLVIVAYLIVASAVIGSVLGDTRRESAGDEAQERLHHADHEQPGG